MASHQTFYPYLTTPGKIEEVVKLKTLIVLPGGSKFLANGK